jgi:bacterioferritin-associated ferredoxin
MAYACLCNQVTDREVLEAIESGARCVDSVMAHCRAGGDCGTCHPTIEDLIEESMGSAVAIRVLQAAAA